MVTCANGHGNQVPGSTCTVCGLALPAPGMQVWGAPAPTPPVSTAASAPPRMPHASDAPSGYAAPSSYAYAATGYTATPAAAQAAPPRRGRTWIVVGAIIAAFVIAGGVTYLVITKPVPDVVGMQPGAALAELGKAGFSDVTTVEEFSDDVPRGDVVSQDPGPGSRARSGQAVSLVVSRGEAKEVPPLVGETVASATRAVTGLELEVVTSSEPSDTVPEGGIIAQEPSPGQVLEEGDVVALVVSSGPPYTTVTVTLDLFTVVLDDNFTDCADAMSILQLFFRSSAIVDGQGNTLSTLSGTWQEVPGNGYLFPCEATGTFPRTPTTESMYRFFMDPSDRSGGGVSYTRSELEAKGWRITLG